MTQETHQAPIPTTVVNGFLGSGKTTIISHLIDELIKDGQKVVYVKNEIGDTDLDAQLMKGKNIIAKELLNGCICCTLVGPFIASINELVTTYQPDRILIESAGNADPASLALMVENHPLLARDGVVTIIDVINFNGFPQLSEVVRRQTEFTDLIIFNKVELADNQRKKQVVGYVRELNEKTPIVEAPHGRIAPNLIFGLGATQLPGFVTAHSHHSDHHEVDDQIRAFTYGENDSLTREKLEKLFRALPKNVFRIKGYFNENGQTWIVNQIFNRANFTLAPTPFKTPSNKLIFIGYQIQNNQAEIVKLLETS